MAVHDTDVRCGELVCILATVVVLPLIPSASPHPSWIPAGTSVDLHPDSQRKRKGLLQPLLRLQLREMKAGGLVRVRIPVGIEVEATLEGLRVGWTRFKDSDN